MGPGNTNALYARIAQSFITRARLALPCRRGEYQHVAWRRKDASRLAQRAASIEHHAHRLARRFDTHIESRIVGNHGCRGGEHRAALRAPVLHVGARLLTRYPLARTVRQRGFTIEAGTRLQANERPAMPHAHEEARVEGFGFGL